MSDWEIIDTPNASQNIQSQSDWQMIETPNSQLRPNESFGEAALKAPYRVGEDVVRGIGEFAKKIPDYYQSAKTEIPGAAKILATNPGKAYNQAFGGLAELGKNVFNTPHDVINYLSQRLNLVPENINKNVQMARMPEDTQQMINQQFGEPKEPGEALLRGAYRNSLNGLGAQGLARTFSPLNLTAKNIAKDVLREERKQVSSHTKQYNKIWNDAEKSGFSNVPVDVSKLTNDLGVISKYKTPREHESLSKFIKNPTLQNAQKAQSDMNIIHRNLGEKSRTSALTSEEKSVYDAAKNAEEHIENNMFKNANGKINKELQNQYKNLTKSYRENVVPYKYNRHIQAYKNREMLAPELINALSRGEFAAKKGHMHRAMGFRNNLKPLLTGAGLLGGGLTIGNTLLGNRPRDESQGSY